MDMYSAIDPIGKTKPAIQKCRRLALVILFVAFTSAFNFRSQCSAQTNQSLDGQLFGLAEEVKNFLANDRLYKGKKIRLDRISTTGMPDANYDSAIQLTLSQALADFIDKKSNFFLKIELTYLVSESNTNRGNRVIQIHSKLLESGIAKWTSTREVNNTSDIGRVGGITQSLPDSTDYLERLAAIEAAFKSPAFIARESTKIQAPGNDKYAIEIRCRKGGSDVSVPVHPLDENGLAFVPIQITDAYEVVLYNYDTQADAVVTLEIDGLDVLSTFCSDKDSTGRSVRYPGYFVPRASGSGPGTHVVRGWMNTVKPGANNIFEFVVMELGKGAASALEVCGEIGVITARFSDAYKPDEQPRSRNFGETGKGEPRKQDYSLVPVQVGTEPSVIISVRYSRPEK
ncbi:hypothetical protein SH449x_003285 [Pirellulaceae bacterium SH449]